MSLAAKQALMAEFLDNPDIEARVRREPQSIAEENQVDLEFVRWLSRIDPRRVHSFRRSRAVKSHRRH